jgi:endoglucanase
MNKKIKSAIIKSFLFITCLLFAFQPLLRAQGFLKAKGKSIVNEKGQNVLLRGIGLGGWMLQEGYMLGIMAEGQQQHKIRQRIDSLIGPEATQEFYDTWLANHTTRGDIDSLRSWGFNSVRLPMHYNLFTLPVEKEPVAGQNTWLTRGFEMVDSLLAWCAANKIYLILDLHAAPGGQGNDLNISDRNPSLPSLWETEANRNKTIALWKKLAERYAGKQWIGAYDILNEPNYGFTDTADRNGLKETKNEPLKKLLVDITKAIREVDHNHIIVIEGNGWGNNYNGMLPPWDDNMVLSFHKYWNKNDKASIKKIVDTREQYNVPVWLGETGENSNVWYAQAVQLLEENNIGWAWWPLKKLGVNNPLQIRSNLNYQDVLNYWNGKGEKPRESNAYSGLLELAAYTRVGTNRVHRDVIDALMRQPHSNKALPFAKNSIQKGTILKAVNYDLGKNGFAYWDRDTADYRVSGIKGVGNRGRTYRNDGVDIVMDSAHYETYYVNHIETGEWLQYTIDVKQKDIYNIGLSVASDTTGGVVSISMNNKMVGTNKMVPVTGGVKKWTTVWFKNISLTAGMQSIRVNADKGGFNFSAIRFDRIK